MTLAVNPEAYVAVGSGHLRGGEPTEIPEEETQSLYRAYIRRLAEAVIGASAGDARAKVMLSTAAPSEVTEAETLAEILSR